MITASKGLLSDREHSILCSPLCASPKYCATVGRKYPFDAQIILSIVLIKVKQVETAIANLVRALEAGIFSSAAKTRTDGLEQQKAALETALADAG